MGAEIWLTRVVLTVMRPGRSRATRATVPTASVDEPALDCIATRTEVIADHAKRTQETLCLLGRLEPPHHTLTLTRRLVRVLCPIVQSLVPTMFRVGQHAPQRRRIARQFVGDHHPRLAARRCEYPP